jgi:hypothetical protein
MHQLLAMLASCTAFTWERRLEEPEMTERQVTLSIRKPTAPERPDGREPRALER